MNGFEIQIADRLIGPGRPTYVIAEISANHNHSIDRAIDLIHLAAESGADAVKIQTYTPDTLTIDCDNDYFVVGKGTLWEGKTLYQLYGEAFTPWDWTGRLLQAARDAGVTLFSTPFDPSSVEFLEEFHLPAYKIASFELVDIPLLQCVARTGKPVILSTGMGTFEEISEAVDTLRKGGCRDLVLLKCTSAYPAPPGEANLTRIAEMACSFSVPVGLSDHTLGGTVAVAAVAMGACVIEKHFTKSRSDPGPDSAFSMEPGEFREMVRDIRTVEASIGQPTYTLTDHERTSRIFRKSIFIVKDLEEGEILSEENCRVIRPGYGLPPRELENVLGKRILRPVKRGTPLEWSLLKDPLPEKDA